MCRSMECGGRRCSKNEQTKANERAAAKRYYARKKARAKIADVAIDGLLAVGDQDMPHTYHWGPKPDLSTFHEVKDPESHIILKPEGALWSAPGNVDADGTVKSEWTDWMVNEGYNFTGPNTIGPTTPDVDVLHVLTPQPGAVIIRVETAEHLHALARRYPTSALTHDGPGPHPFSWEAIREDGIDAVFLTSNGLDAASSDAKFEVLADSWGVSSVAWLRGTCLKVDGEVRRGSYPTNEDPSEQWTGLDPLTRDVLARYYAND